MFADESCQSKYDSADIIIEVTGHSFPLVHVEEVEAKGSTAGNIEYWMCAACDTCFSDALGETEIKLKDTVVVSVDTLVDFVVEIEEYRDIIVLQLTDTQIIDASQKRFPERLGPTADEYWGTDKLEDRCFQYIRETIEAVKPDFIILTGDIVYGEFDDSGAAFLAIVNFMESFDIPWAPIFGNHEAESAKGVDWQCEQLENAKNCLFKQRTLTGNGNYTVGIKQNGQLKRVFFMMDSNSNGSASTASISNGHTSRSTGFGADQISWFTKTGEQINKVSPNTKISFAFHIQIQVFKNAYEKYGFTNSNTINNPINIDKIEDKADGDFGYIGRDLKSSWDLNHTVWNQIKALGTDSIFVGHEHCNSASVVYEDVRFQFGQKASTYDRANYVRSNGTIVGAYDNQGMPLVGGTVMPLSQEDGSIKNPYIYLCGDIDWSQWDPDKDIEVNGLQLGEDLTANSAISMMAVKFDAKTDAYKVVANSQGKVFVDVNLLKNKNTFTFSVYITETSISKLGGFGEFAIRVKPNGFEPVKDGKTDGYIDYNSSATNTELLIEFEKWQTFVVDISNFGESCEEFSFVVAKGNTIYLKDLMIE